MEHKTPLKADTLTRSPMSAHLQLRAADKPETALPARFIDFIVQTIETTSAASGGQNVCQIQGIN